MDPMGESAALPSPMLADAGFGMREVRIITDVGAKSCARCLARGGFT